MERLSAVIIAKDEADRIEDAIRSVGFCDEVLVLDSGSTDGTPELAAALGARVVRTDWPGFVAQKARATAAASHDWVLSIDADERVPPALAAEITALRERGLAAAGYRLPRLSWWMGAPVRRGTWWPDARVRLFDRRRAAWGGLDPHDRVDCAGPVAALHAPLHHHPYRDLGEHLQTIDRYAAISAAAARAQGRRASALDVGLRPVAHLFKALILKGGVLDGPRGWALAWLGAAHCALKWLRIAAGPPSGGAP